LGIIAFVAVINFGLAGCKTDDDGGGGGSDTALVAKWYITQAYADSQDNFYVAYEFTSDGKLGISTASVDAGLTYTASSGTITVKSAGYTVGTATYSIAGTELTLSNVGSSTLMAGTYYKKATS
jgi:hypothetical protein